MLRKLLFFVFAFLSVTGLIAQSGTLKGKVLDKETGEPIPFANVVVELGGELIGGGSTDFDGWYTIKPLPTGKYSVKASYVGYTSLQQVRVVINAEQITFLNFKLGSSSEQIGVVDVVAYVVPVFKKDAGSSGETMTSEQITKMPGRSAAAVATTVAGVYSEGGEIGSIRGARSSGNVTYVDGVKIIGSSALPQAAISEVSVKTGGLPAKFGDATGGVISITTKGPSPKLFGGMEIVTSEFLDPYGYNLIGAMVSGPIWSRQDPDYPDRKNTVLGYFLSGEARYTKDGSPSIIPLYRAKDDVRQDIIANPLQTVNDGFGTNARADFLHEDAFETYNVKQGDDDYRVNVAGKIEFKPSKQSSIILGGSALHQKSNNWSFSGAMFNSDNFSESYYTNWRSYARYTQRFLNSDDTAQFIKNAFYTIQFDYENTFGKTWDKDHQDNLFDYGYVGKFTTYKIPSYTFGMETDSVTGMQAHLLNGFFDTLVAYEYSDVNYEVANYTQRYYDIFEGQSLYFINNTLIQQGGGLLNGESPQSIYGLFDSPGQLATNYSRLTSVSRSNFTSNQFRVSAAGSADIGNHAISIGFEFEQRSSSSYNVGPSGLWTLGRGLMNKHIEQIDINNPILHYLVDEYGNVINDDFGNPVFNDTISYNRLYSESDQALFDIKFREHLGLEVDGLDWVDIDNYDPSEFDISYFSADELLNSGNSYVGFLGYDVHGNLLKNDPSLQDFFSKKDDYGRYTRNLAPYEPTYTAAYIQDKFSFNDLIFNVGLRIDRFDANQKVLKDQYTLYEAYTAGDQNVNDVLNTTHPDNIGEDYVVYVDNSDNPSQILGYRDEGTWYDAEGTEIDDPDAISTATGIQPYLVNPGIDMSSEQYEVSQSFEDYKPQITIMPRISFSFPISDVAVFFAHYDVLSTRPGGINISPIDYLFMNVRATNNNVLTNPNLKPEKTIDYEIGFKQKIGNSSAMSISSFYREMRDMRQAINVVGAYPVYRYLTYGNIDFGTVKGFSVSYDMRRIGNVSIRASYVLQFANGTGSSANEGVSLLNSGQPNLRTTIPLSFDQRHAIITNIDFRFFDGKAYNGPKLFNKDILQNTGANLVIRAGSGSPYSKRSIIGGVLEGSINGSRKPWRTTLDLTLDRDIVITWGKEEDGKKKQSVMNIKLEVLNLLNTANILNVYSTTGNPNDDGYLHAAANQPAIEAQNDEIAYRNYYVMSLQRPWNYSRPRTIRLGVSLSF